MRHWFWLAFEDLDAPPGTRARGALILGCDTPSEIDAMARAAEFVHAGGVPPTLLAYTVHLAEVDPRHGPPWATWIHRHLDNDQAAAVAAQWTGGVASRAQIRDAFADDAAAPGTPLFRHALLARPIPIKRGDR